MASPTQQGSMAQQSHSPNESELERVPSHTVTEGDRIVMGISAHGTATDLPGVEYYTDEYQAGAEGTVIDAPRESSRELMAEGTLVMADVAIETDDGTVYRWNIDNGYVIGPHQSLGRRSDVGKISGIYRVVEDV